MNLDDLQLGAQQEKFEFRVDWVVFHMFSMLLSTRQPTVGAGSSKLPGDIAFWIESINNSTRSSQALTILRFEILFVDTRI